MSSQGLGEIQGALLSYTTLESEQLAADDGNPVTQLLVRLQGDTVLRIFCANDVLEAGAEETSSVFYFVARYTGEVPLRMRAELVRLLGVLNQLLPLGTLELHPEEGVFFRHMLLAEDTVLDGLLALDVIRCLDVLLQHVFAWLTQVLTPEAPSSPELQQQIRQQFRQLLQQLPLNAPPRVFPPPPKLPASAVKWQSYGLVLGIAAVVAGITGFLFNGLWACVMGIGCALLLRSQQHRFVKPSHHEQRRQLRFYWQLLEVESIKLDYQSHSLEQHRQQVHQKLLELAERPVDYPADVLRLRTQMRFLRQFQMHLLQRTQQVRHQREELEHSRSKLIQERAELLTPGPQPDLLPLKRELGAEDVLMQNLVVTLEYLDFAVQLVAPTSGTSPALLVHLRSDLPPVVISWLRAWSPENAPTPEHSWMICFDLVLPQQIPDTSWPRIYELLRLFNRFLPLGTLLCDYVNHQISLRYRFVRLRGDLSTLLVMEVLEVLATFGERLQQRLLECLAEDKHLETILYEAEQEFLALQA
ncbi:MAG: hypothetical protein ACO1RX_17635 [Candidatus Sericytochromatia bacterium]